MNVYESMGLKPSMDRLAVVTATLDRDRAAEAIESWRSAAAYDWPLFVVEERLGVVPAFAEGVSRAFENSRTEVVVCLHDDVLIEESGWDLRVLTHFQQHPQCGLAGFGGATGLGSLDLYRTPYDPRQLARVDFRSNMLEAEAHGTRTAQLCRVACLDGFSQIGRRRFFGRAWPFLQEQGLQHHFYDSALGCLAKRWGEEAWLIPVACHHDGGQTTQRDRSSESWAYEEFRDVLPIRV